MTSFEQETITPMNMASTDTSAVSLWPDARLIALSRKAITHGASRQPHAYFPTGRQQLLEVLSAMHAVDTQVLQLIDGVRVCLGDIDISDYRAAIQRLDKPGRTAAEDAAFVHFQQEIGNVLMQALDTARLHVDTLDLGLQGLEAVVVDDNRALIFELESRLGSQVGEPDALVLQLLEELKGPEQVVVARHHYVHEVGKLVFAMGYFFDCVMAGCPEVIQRAEDFQRHTDSLLADLQRLREEWDLDSQ